MFSTVGKQLVRGEDNNSGRVTTLIAQNPDGAYVKYEASKAVVLAAGDFSADKDMMCKYGPWAAQLITDDVYEADVDYDKEFPYGDPLKGDGHKMGLRVCAAWQKTNAPMQVSAICGPAQNTEQNYIGLLVDRNGERFSNEYSGVTLGFLNNQMQVSNKCYAIWSLDYLDAIKDGWYPGFAQYNVTPKMSHEEVITGWSTNVESGMYVKDDTVKEVIETFGLPMEQTMSTVDRYNEMREAGKDTDFYKRPEALFPIKKGPFYGQASSGQMFLTVLGGLRTNSNMQVCDADDNPIEGLYNVGTMVGDFHSGMYTLQLPGINYGGCRLTLGYLTGRYC